MRQHLVETTLLHPTEYKKVDRPLAEAIDADGNQYKALAVYRFEFTRPDEENLNGRIYPSELWQKVIDDNPTTLSLADHPEEGAGRPQDIWAVVRNPRFSDDRKVVTADCYILDCELGRKALAVLEAGGDVGLSSSGYGDFEADGITVDPKSFVLERYFDWVLNPSYEVYGHQSDIIGTQAIEAVKEKKKANEDDKDKDDKDKDDKDKDDKDKDDSKKDSDEDSEESDDKKKKNDKEDDKKSDESNDKKKAQKENAMEAEKKALSMREKRAIELSMRAIVEGLRAIKDPEERLAKAKESLTFYEDEEFTPGKDEIESIVQAAEQAIEQVAQAEVEAQQAEHDELVTAKEDSEARVIELQNELDGVKAELEASRKENEISAQLVTAFTADAQSKVEYNEYTELRAYAKKAVALLSEKRSEIDSLRRENENLMNEAGNLRAQVESLKRAERARLNDIKEQKRVREEKRVLGNQRTRDLHEQLLMEQASPAVLSYYDDLIARGEDVAFMREGILKCHTLLEAQRYFLKNKNHKILETPEVHHDLSESLKPSRGTEVRTALSLPKGFI